MVDLDLTLQRQLEDLKRQKLFREMKRIDSMQGPAVSIDGRQVILFSSNNYLGLASHPEVIKAQVQAAEEFGAGSCASRLISGNMLLHEKLEERIAGFKSTESAIVFSTGYMANVGTISAIADKGDLVICDKLNHASIIDGVRLSGATLRIYPHKNVERLKEILSKTSTHNKKLIITDGVFSMDGDIAPLPELIEISKSYGAILMLDDAHATGVLGRRGRGTCEYFGIKEGIDIQMGTFSKALGNLGGFVTGSKTLMEYIRNNARSFIYSTSLPPAILAGALRAIEISEKGNDLREKLWSNVKRLRDGLSGLGLNIMDTKTQIIPVFTGDISSTMKASEILLEKGIFAPGIRPPTVPKNKCRIRLSLMSTHTEEHIDKAIEIFRSLKDEGIFCNGN